MHVFLHSMFSILKMILTTFVLFFVFVFKFPFPSCCRLNLFLSPCLSYYQVGVNQDKGVRVGDAVRYHDEEAANYKVKAIDTSTYRTPVYDLENINTELVLEKVNRSEIGASSWKSVRALTYERRLEIWGNTDAFTFDHDTQNAFDNGYQTMVPDGLKGVVSAQLHGGGFASDVPIHSLTQFDKHMSTLKRNVWIDEKTRGIEVSFNMYNTNYDFLITTHALFEITPGGGINTRKTVKVVRLCDNWKAEDITRIQMEFVCLTLLILGYLSVMLSACSKCMDEPDSDSAELLDYYNTQAIKNKQSKVRRGKHLKSNPDSCAEILRGLPIRCSRAGGKNDCCCFMFRVFIIACLKLMPPSFFEPQVC